MSLFGRGWRQNVFYANFSIALGKIFRKVSVFQGRANGLRGTLLTPCERKLVLSVSPELLRDATEMGIIFGSGSKIEKD